MEDKDDNGGLEDKLRKMIDKLSGGSGKKRLAGSDPVPEGFKTCSVIYRSVFGSDNSLPIYLGVDIKADELFLGFGTEDPFKINFKEALYLVAAITGLVNKAYKEHKGGMDASTRMPPIMKDTHFSMGQVHEDSVTQSDEPEQDPTEDLKKAIYGDESTDEEATQQDLEELKASLKEVENMKEQAEEFTKNMSKEEREQYMKDLAKKQEELLAKKARDFERNLLGTIEEEDETVYNYNYFKEIHDKHGQAALKEELAKLPKEERQEIIEKIKSEYKLKKQQKDSNNEKSNH